MKRVADHLSDVLATVHSLPPLELQLLDAHGCVLVEDVVSQVSLPRFDTAGVEGYAVRARDVAGATESEPVVLPVVGDIVVGDEAPYALGPGLAARVSAGAAMPRDADAVVPSDATDRGLARVAITAPVAEGDGFQRAGEDVSNGEVVVPAGSSLGATQIGLLAATGQDRVRVRPRPRVVVLSTGTGLVDPGASVHGLQRTDANGFLLTSAAREAGAVAYRIAAVADDPKVLRDAVEDQLIRADLLVTSGGIGDSADAALRDVLSGLGGVEFTDLAMDPGSAHGFGTIGDEQVPVFSLPDQAVGAYVAFEVFVRPAIRKLLGVPRLHRPSVRASLTRPLVSPEGRRQFARAKLEALDDGSYSATPMDDQGGHMIAGLARADGLIVVPEAVTRVESGQMMDVMLLERRRG